MATGKFRGNEATKVVNVTSDNGVHVGFGGDFGGGAVAVKKVIGGTPHPLYDGGVAISYSSVDDDNLLLVRGDFIQLEMSGASSPELDWTVTGAS